MSEGLTVSHGLGAECSAFALPIPPCCIPLTHPGSHLKSWACRKFAVFLRRFPSIRTDVVGLLDEWAARFFEELDYVREGNNGILFAKQMAKDLPQVCCLHLTVKHVPHCSKCTCCIQTVCYHSWPASFGLAAQVSLSWIHVKPW